ncbi:glycosyl hydrolases family 18-domain-containing protein [Lipomyces kononenkoae]|uniref:Glycosyl hydrolases family 18-domain-containing protein n=1 Tax=Lipomyces kononenkoae TaxID=34357 RepID=A0ACC3TCA6_LIPKO
MHVRLNSLKSTRRHKTHGLQNRNRDHIDGISSVADASISLGPYETVDPYMLPSQQAATVTSTTHRTMATAPTSSAKRNYTNSIYYPDWACNILPPTELPIANLTHIYYAFVGLNSDGSIYLTEPDSAGTTGSTYLSSQKCLTALRDVRNKYKPELKLLVSVGGGSGSTNFATVASDYNRRTKFARALKNLLDQYSFDGVDVDWESPTGVDEGIYYLQLLRTLRSNFPAGTYTLTATYTGTLWALSAIDIPECIINVDQFNIMAYDYYGPWNGTSGYHGQLYSSTKGGDSGSDAVTYCLQNSTVPSDKLVLGIPLYAQGFPGVTGPDMTWSRSAMSVDGIQVQYNDLGIGPSGADVYYDATLVGASIYNGSDNIWYTFDNEQSVKTKASFVKAKDLGGVFFWQGTGDLLGSRLSLITVAARVLGIAS